MPRKLNTKDAGFGADFSALLESRRQDDADIAKEVAAIIADVINRGDEAILELTRKFDGLDVKTMDDLRYDKSALKSAHGRIAPELQEALEIAAQRIRAFHEKQKPADLFYTDEAGVGLGWRYGAVDSAGLYVPGGKAAYPSSVLMNGIPAVVAGVARLAMAVPTTRGAPHGDCSDMVLGAAHVVGITEVWTIGGAQAIAALAYGTDSITAVDKIVGPGNAYVAAAKRQVFGQVGIDSIAGPSEVLIIADGHNNADWLAMDLLAQAEHDEAAQSLLITDDEDFAQKILEAVEAALPSLARRDIAEASWQNHGAVIVVKTWDEAAELANKIAPEHLQIATEDPHQFAAKIRHAGAIFLGQWTPEAIGDYVAGPNHVLPTARTARFSSGLGVMDFMKRTTMVECSADALGKIGSAAERLAEAEGLQAHGRSISQRLN